jgi:hypothetical protein
MDAFDVVDLSPGANLTMLFTWDTSDVSAGSVYKLKAEASNVAHEMNTANNVFIDGTVKVKIIGDVNGDNRVNIDDWNAFDLAWGTHPGDPNWNAQADISGDGVVDIYDAILLAAHSIQRQPRSYGYLLQTVCEEQSGKGCFYDQPDGVFFLVVS